MFIKLHKYSTRSEIFIWFAPGTTIERYKASYVGAKVQTTQADMPLYIHEKPHEILRIIETTKSERNQWNNNLKFTTTRSLEYLRSC